jgi:hypothetical protein
MLTTHLYLASRVSMGEANTLLFWWPTLRKLEQLYLQSNYFAMV